MSGDEATGTLVLVVGPSGAGKDTLIAHAKAALDDRFVFPRRVVTRASSPWEEHDSVEPAEFDRMEAAGAFALSWRAHGFAYGIPAAIRDDLRAGRTVVVNVSRGIVPQARAELPRVSVIVVTAPADVISARLSARGRDAGVASRRERAGIEVPLGANDTVVDNSGDLAPAQAHFLAAVMAAATSLRAVQR